MVHQHVVTLLVGGGHPVLSHCRPFTSWNIALALSILCTCSLRHTSTVSRNLQDREHIETTLEVP